MWAMLQAPLMATPLSKKAKVSPEESRPLAAGTRVVLRGLKGSSEHNGTYALVRSYDEARSRYCVALEAGKGSEVSVKPQCVHELDAGEGTHLRHKVLAHEHVRELLGVNLEEGAVQWFGGDRQRITIKHSCTSAECAYTRRFQSQYIEVKESDENGVFDVGKYLTLAVRKLLQKHNQCFPSLTFDALMAAPSEQQLATQVPIRLRAPFRFRCRCHGRRPPVAECASELCFLCRCRIRRTART